MAGHPTRIELRPTDLVAVHYLQKLVLSPSQNISICWLLPIMFDHSSYSKNLRKYYLFCYDKFYYHIYLKYILIVFIFFSIFFNKKNGQTWSAEVKIYLYFGTEVVTIKPKMSPHRSFRTRKPSRDPRHCDRVRSRCDLLFSSFR